MAQRPSPGGSIHRVVAANGGYVPPVRRRSARMLSLAEREDISRGVAGGLSAMRRSAHATTKGQGRGGITDAASIGERPTEVGDRSVPGH
jgi:hypothetical protein